MKRRNMRILNQDICSRVWTEPIKSQSDGKQKVGLEMEIFAYYADNLLPFGTEETKLNSQDFFKRIQSVSKSSKLIKDKQSGIIIGVSLENGGNFSMEPGGQIEYSSAPFENLSELIKDVISGLKILESASSGQLVFLSHGTNPVARNDHPLVLAKERYQVMTRYFNSASSEIRGIDMMRHSATVQANIDVFGNENWQDAVNLVLSLVPHTQQLFANSFYFQGRSSLYSSERQEIWRKMDPSRSGYPTGLLFAENTECAYATWAKTAYVFYIEGLDLKEQPLYGQLTFEDWLKNGYRGTTPTLKNWETHLGTLFPDLRLRRFLEIRHIDAQPFEHTFAPVAFFSSVVYSKKSRELFWNFLTKNNLRLNKDEFDIEKKELAVEQLHELLELSATLLEDCGQKVGAQSVLAYKEFISEKQFIKKTMQANEFVRNYASSSPAKEFQKNLIHLSL